MSELPLTMPKMSMTMEEGTMVAWLKQVGDPVRSGEPICEVATDKVDMEVESPFDGVLARIIAQPDEVYAVGDTIAFITTEADDLLGGLFDEPAAEAPTAAPAAAEEAPVAAPAPIETGSISPPSLRPVQTTPCAFRMSKLLQQAPHVRLSPRLLALPQRPPRLPLRLLRLLHPFQPLHPLRPLTRLKLDASAPASKWPR